MIELTRRRPAGLPYQGPLVVEEPLGLISSEAEQPQLQPCGIWGSVSESAYRREGVGEHPLVAG